MKNKIFFFLFMLVWVGLTVLNFLIPNKSFSQQENRYLASFPKFSFRDLVQGRYAEELDSYINDHFVARNFWLKFHSFVQLLEGKTENNGIYIGQDGYLFEPFVYKEEEQKNLEKISQAVNTFVEKLEVPTYFLLIPNSIYSNQEKLPKHLQVEDQSKVIQQFYAQCTKKIKTIDVAEILKENKDKQLYFRTDHHITSDGAYLVYEQYCKSAKIEPVALTNMRKEIVSKNFLGTFDSKAQVPNQKADEIVVYKNERNEKVTGNYDGRVYNALFKEEYLQQKDQYSYFLNGNWAKVVIKTNLNNGKKLLVIKDSYAHIVAQFLCQNYEEIHFLDPRYYKASLTEYTKENSISEVLFLYNIGNLVEENSLRNLK